MRLSDFNIVYINLKKRPKKREYIENELDKVGLLKQSTWINGIDGSTLSKNIQNHYLNNFKTMAKKKTGLLVELVVF
jgi:hypothetical protein